MSGRAAPSDAEDVRGSARAATDPRRAYNPQWDKRGWEAPKSKAALEAEAEGGADFPMMAASGMASMGLFLKIELLCGAALLVALYSVGNRKGPPASYKWMSFVTALTFSLAGLMAIVLTEMRPADAAPLHARPGVLSFFGLDGAFNTLLKTVGLQR